MTFCRSNRRGPLRRSHPLGLVFALALMFSGAARADALAPTDEGAIHTVISGQIAAFARDDGTAAYAAASPDIQARFPSVSEFMTMVTGLYQPVYHPRSVAFGPLVDTPNGPLQRVFLVGPDGLGYVADYLMEKQPDGSWRIGGVSLMRNDQPSI